MTNKTIEALDIVDIVLKEGGGLSAVQEALVGPTTYREQPKTLADRRVPPPVVLTEEVKRAIRRLPEVFAEVQPTEARALSDEEFVQVYAEYEVLKTINDLLSGRYEDLKDFVRNHMDEVAVAQKKANRNTPLDANGHYILAAPKNPERANIPETNLAFSREYRKGTMTFDSSVIEEMLAEGQISRETYLAVTSERRVFDSKKMEANLTKAPREVREEIVKVIRKMTKIGLPGTSLFVRKAN